MDVLGQIAVNVLIGWAPLVLSALGFSLIYGCCRFLHFAHGVLYTVGAYVVLVCIRDAHLGPGPAVVVATLIGSALGALCEIGLYRPLVDRGSSPLVMLLVSIGAYVATQNALSLGFGDDSKVAYSVKTISEVGNLGISMTGIQARSIAVSVVVVVTTWVYLRRSRFGRWITAVADDASLAFSLGVPVRQVGIGVFAMGSALASCAGGLSAWDTKISPTMGMQMLIASVVVVIIGGVGSFGGTIIAAFLVATVQQSSAWFFGARWQDAGVFIALIVFLALRPEGVRGLRQRGWAA